MPLIGTGVVALRTDKARRFIVIAGWAFFAEEIGEGLAMDIGQEQRSFLRYELILVATDVDDQWNAAGTIFEQCAAAR